MSLARPKNWQFEARLHSKEGVPLTSRADDGGDVADATARCSTCKRRLFGDRGMQIMQVLAFMVLAAFLILLAIPSKLWDVYVPLCWSTTSDHPKEALEARLAWFSVAFVAMAMTDHLARLLFYKGYYQRFLKAEIKVDWLRWSQYFFSASTMVWQIAILTLIQDITAGLSLASLTAVMILFGAVQERDTERDGRNASKWAFWMGCVPFAVVWSFILAQFIYAADKSERGVPDFVYAVVILQAVLYSFFGVNQWLYVYGFVGRIAYAWGFDLLSVVAKTTLSGIVYGGINAAASGSMNFTSCDLVYQPRAPR